MTTPRPGDARPLNAAEEAVVGVLDTACRELGLDGGVPAAVLESVESELRARTPRPAHADPAADAEVQEREWAEIGAAAAVGVLFASEMAAMKRRSRQSPASAGFEPLEVARLSSGALVSLLLRRWARARLGRDRRERGDPEGPA